MKQEYNTAIDVIGWIMDPYTSMTKEERQPGNMGSKKHGCERRWRVQGCARATTLVFLDIL
jgi:hypothetical protein